MMKKPLAHRLRHRVTVQTFTTVQDSNTGAVTDTWADVFTDLPAEIYPMSGREFVAAQSIQAGVTTKITVRDVGSIEPRMRVLHGASIYNIKAVLPDPSLARHLTLMCEVGVNNG
jgi:SPP1 family predicted phage head-tail adaptor